MSAVRNSSMGEKQVVLQDSAVMSRVPDRVGNMEYVYLELEQSSV